MFYSPSDTGQSFTWTTSNSNVATVSNGKITAKNTCGVAVITATHGNYSLKITVRVVLPTSGSEIYYEPAKWNYAPVQTKTNCYSYALNNQVLPGTNTLTFMQPGQSEYTKQDSKLPPLTKADYTSTGTKVIEYVKYDAKNYGFTFEEIDRNATCSKGSYKVALVIAPNLDFHWYRENPDGTWSHKPGGTEVTIWDCSQNVIYDPKYADRNDGVRNYTAFIGYFRVTPMNNFYQSTRSTNIDANIQTSDDRKSELSGEITTTTNDNIEIGMTYSQVTAMWGYAERSISDNEIILEYFHNNQSIYVTYAKNEGELIVYEIHS